MLVDTDVLIWYMKGNQRAKKAIDGLESFDISAVNYMELLQGVRNKDELRVLQKYISQRGIGIVHISQEISQRALYYMEQYTLSHHLRMADAIIAATTYETDTTLLTGNSKHYRAVREIQIRRFRP